MVLTGDFTLRRAFAPLCVLCALLAFAGAAAAGTITGTVTADATGLPIEGATVTADSWFGGTEYKANTDAAGVYAMTVVEGTYQVYARALGYDEATENPVTVTTFGTTTVDFALTGGGLPPGNGGPMSCPEWYIELDDFGYSDWMIQTFPGQVEHENLSGEWGAAIRYDGIATGGDSMWLTPQFLFPDWTTNSTFTVLQSYSCHDDPANPVVGNDTGQAKIGNGVVEITIDYHMRSTPNGVVAGLRPGGEGTIEPASSGHYVLQVDYTIKNVSGGSLNHLALYQFLHAHPNDDYEAHNFGIYDPTDYGLGDFPEYRYRITQYGQSFWNAPGSDLTGFSAKHAPAAYAIGQYPGLDGKPTTGLHLDVEADTLSGATAAGPAEVAGAMKWSYGTLAAGASVTESVLLWDGWQQAELPQDQPVSPYPDEDEWSTGAWYPHLGQLHVHFTPDIYGLDDQPTLEDILDWYGQGNYEFVAVTEHQSRLPREDAVDQPVPPGLLSLEVSAEDTVDNNGEGSHILAVGADPAVAATDTTWGAFLHDFGYDGHSDSTADRRVRLNNINDEGGLALVAHPNDPASRWTPLQLQDLMGAYQGLEIYNTGSDNAGRRAGYAAAYKDTDDPLLALDAALQEGYRQGYALDTWETLLQHDPGRTTSGWGLAGDDYHPDILSKDNSDTTSVVVWTESPTPNEEQLKEALRAGRFYARTGGAAGPTILSYWADPSTHTVGIKTVAPYGVRFFTGRVGRGATATPALQEDGSYLATFPYLGDDLYVRAEVTDSSGRRAWLAPIWVVEAQEVMAMAGGTAGTVAVTMLGAELDLAWPQSEFTETVVGALQGGDARPAAPPMGYLSRCYLFTPEEAVSGSNTLTISFFPDLVQGFPESALAIYHYDRTSHHWDRLASTVDTGDDTVSCTPTELGLFAVSAERVTDEEPPTLTITSPASGGTISAPTMLGATAADNQGVVSVSFFLDGWYLGTDTWGHDVWSVPFTPVYSVSGDRVLTAVAEDAAGNVAEASVPVSIVGPLTAPAISMTSPSEGDTIWADLHFAGGWDGALPMATGLLAVNDTFVGSLRPTENHWQFDIPIPLDEGGPATLLVGGYDRYGNRAWQSVNVTLKVFNDVPPGYWARRQIYAAARAGVVQGYENGAYDPAGVVTRGQMAVYIARALVGGDVNVPDPPANTQSFRDVPFTGYGPNGTDPYWAYKYIEYCAAQKVVEGYNDGTYQPEVAVNRGQMAVYIARALVTPSGDAGIAEPSGPATFADVPGPDNAWAWCWKHVEFCHDSGVVQGYYDGYHPEYAVLRDQMAVYIARAFSLAM